MFEGDKTPILAGSELQNSQAEHYVDNLVDLAKEFGRWVPLVAAKGEHIHFEHGGVREGMGLLIDKGLVMMRELQDGKRLFIPTEKLVEFVGRYLKA